MGTDRVPGTGIVDLRGLSYVSSPQMTLAGHGAVATLHLDGGLASVAGGTVVEWLGAVETHDDLRRAGSGVVAMGALPFSRTAPARLVVPEVIYRCDETAKSVTIVREVVPRERGRRGPDLENLRAHALGQARMFFSGSGVASVGTGYTHAPTSEEPVPVTGEEDFVRSVEVALEEIARRSLTKVVLARKVDVRFDGPIDVGSVLARLKLNEPHSTVFAFADGDAPGGGGETFLGASPELLLSKRGRSVRSQPLAGTIGLTGDDTVDTAAIAAFMSSRKERTEHAIVVDEVCRELAPLCRSLSVREVPEVVALHGIAHLGTPIDGELRKSNPHAARSSSQYPDALTILSTLHPTPAVGGSPSSAALQLIDRLEPCSRGRYAGPVGWIDARGDGDFVIGIRSASIRGPRASLHAGVGIVAGSDPKEELAETSLKLRTALGALGI